MARAFANFQSADNVVIFASGVPNSLESDPAEFFREQQLLEQIRQEYPQAVLVYFGTCSVGDPDRFDTPYVQHKVRMEELLAKSAGNYLVLRLPLVIGPSDRATTLARFLYDRIVRGEEFCLWDRAVRYPLDVADAVRISARLIEDKGLRNRTINVALRSFLVADFVRILEEIVGRRAHFRVLHKGRPFEVLCPEVVLLSKELKLDYSDLYLERALRNYFTRPPSV